MTHFFSETLGLTPSAFTLLRDLIHDRTGIYFENGKQDLLADKLSPMVIEAGFDSFLDYYYLLKYDTDVPEEWGRLMNTITVQETYFWRELDQIRALIDVILPEYTKDHPDQPIRIWSAACATGEEPLSMAMALKEHGWFQRWPLTIHASDASAAALEKARQGVYWGRSFRNLPPQLQARYFEEDPGGQRVSPSIHDRVIWSKANIMVDEEIRSLAQSPFIFCRNVFIYFSKTSIKKTVALFHRYMPTPGYLFTGASESLLTVTRDFELEEIGGAFVYVKR